MGDAIRSVLSQYATFSGRAGRAEFWWWVLAAFLGSLVIGALDNALFPPLVAEVDAFGGGPLSAIYGLALLLPNLAVNVRRLHDGDRSGWWLLIVLVPIIGFLVLLWFFVRRGTPGPNRFGPVPVLGAPAG
jgi:uncharacterized membrane protein YhaH (DUF805 family)